MYRKKKIVQIQISQIPHHLTQGVLKDQYMLFDNLEEEKTTNLQKTDDPIQTNDLLSIHIVRGTLEMEVNHETIILKERQIISIMPGSIFKLLQDSPDLIYFGFAIHADRITEMLRNLRIEASLSERSQCFYKHQGNVQTLSDSLKIYKLIKDELALPAYQTQPLVIQRYCEILALKDYKLYEESERAIATPANNRQEELFHLFLQLLEENYLRERNTGFYASKLCISPKYLSSIIKEQSGKTCADWIGEYISFNARGLLKDSTLSIKQISDRLGFPSQSVFGRFFKKVNGVSPKVFRNQQDL